VVVDGYARCRIAPAQTGCFRCLVPDCASCHSLASWLAVQSAPYSGHSTRSDSLGASSSPNENSEERVNSSEKDSLSRKFEEHHTFLRDVAQGIEERAQVTTWWFTAGLVGFIVLVSGDLGAQVMRAAPLLLTCLLLTFTLGSGITLILSRSSFLSSKRILEGAYEINVKVDEGWRQFHAALPESLYTEKVATLAEDEQMRLLELLEKLLSATKEAGSLWDDLMKDSSRQVSRSMKRMRWGGFLFNISLVLALLAATSFLASVWWPAVFQA
jgi:hypothetical protein